MKFKKVITMGVAAIMAVSAMSISAFACKNAEDAIVTAVAPDGETLIYLSEQDIESGNNTIEVVGGLTVKFETGDDEIEMKPPISLYTMYGGYSRSNIPGTPSNLNDDTYSGDFSVGRGKTVYSDDLLQTSNENVLFEVTNPNRAFGGMVDFSFCTRQSGRIFTLSPKEKHTTATVLPLTPVTQFYAEIHNKTVQTASGTLNMTTY